MQLLIRSSRPPISHTDRKTKLEKQVDHEYEKIEREKQEAKEKRMIANELVRPTLFPSLLSAFLSSSQCRI